MKFIKNNYDRIEIRAKIECLNEYDTERNFVKRHQYSKFMEVIDEIMK